MTRGALRFTEEQFRAHREKITQRPPEDSSRPLLPARGAPTTGIAFVVGTPMPQGVVTTATSASKYRNEPTNGYASKREAKRAAELKLMQEAGQIRNLREQVSYLLIPKQAGERACSYVADFVYEEQFSPGKSVAEGNYWMECVEDCKGMKTDVYRIKKKLMLMVHGIRIRET